MNDLVHIPYALAKQTRVKKWSGISISKGLQSAASRWPRH